MRLLVLGSKGMLGRDLVSSAKAAGIQTIGYDIDELDITDARQVKSQLPRADWVVNCAAYTRVDDAEKEREQAYAINSEGPHNLARECRKKRMRLLHISTDYVFDGARGEPYRETDQTNPVSVYGASKLAGEKAVRSEGASYLIVRTQSLFGLHGPNFVRSIGRKLLSGETPLRVVDDQVSAPTYTRHLADALLRLMDAKAQGIVHVAATRACSWFDFAKAIAAHVQPGAAVEPIKAADLGLPAVRPPYSVLDMTRFRQLTGHVMPSWEAGLEDYLKQEGALS